MFMLYIKEEENDGQLEFNLFGESPTTEQLTLTEWQVLQDLEVVWNRVKRIYKEGIPLSRFFDNVDIFDNKNNERSMLKSVRELCSQNESLIKQYINLYLK